MAGTTIWITGLPGSGKSTLSDEIKKLFPFFHILRMDELRKTVTPLPTYSDEERDIVYRSLVFTSKTLTELGHDVIIDATGNLKRWRLLARRLIPGYMEVYLRCPIDICMKREMKRVDTHEAPEDIYEKAKRGWPVPGMTAPYEPPEDPELIIDTETTPLREAVRLLSEMIESQKT